MSLELVKHDVSSRALKLQIEARVLHSGCWLLPKTSDETFNQYQFMSLCIKPWTSGGY